MDAARDNRRAFFADDGGFTTVGMVLALLIALSLVFSATQVYRIHALSADVQNVADVAALAAENQVASFYVAAQVCDAVVLTMSLVGIAVGAVGVVCLCVPPVAGAGEKLIEVARKVVDARDRCSRAMAKGLNAVQRLLPFIAAAQGASVAASNNTAGATYAAIAVLLPLEGAQIESAELGGTAVMDEIAGKRDAIERDAQRAEEAAKQVDALREQAFKLDCGDYPGRCMAERAQGLAGMSGTSNPLYHSAQTWSFSVALQRVRTYYDRRLANEQPANSSLEEQRRSALRTQYYRYARSQMRTARAVDTDEACDLYFPSLPTSTAQMRQTSLYTDAVYPVTQAEDGAYVMHAWSGCPGAQDVVWQGSIAQMEAGGFKTCEHCEFSAALVGQIAQMTAISATGFEKYYIAFAKIANEYAAQRAQQLQSSGAVKRPVSDLLGKLKDLGSQAARARISVEPPGRNGAVAVAASLTSVSVASLTSVSVASLAPVRFTGSSGSLGPRAALSAAALKQDEASETGSIITSLFDGFLADSGGYPAQVSHVVLGLWSGMLQAHASGTDAVTGAVRSALDGLPLASSSGLGTWAANKLKGLVADMGLQPADLSAHRPVLVNSWEVIQTGSEPVNEFFATAKAVGRHLPATAVNPLGGAVSAAVSVATERIDGLGDEIEVATIRLFGDAGPSIPVKVAVPTAAKEGAKGAIEGAAGQLKAVTGSGDDDVWQ